MSTRYIEEVVELDRDCELGELGERAVVTAIDGRYMTLIFSNRRTQRQRITTGIDYKFLRTVVDTTTKRPVEIDGWYEHTDGTFGFYVGAARAGGPTMTQGPCAAHECVKRDEHGTVYEIGWPARFAGVAP